MRVASVGRALPPNYYGQQALLAAFTDLWGDRFHNPARLEQIHHNVLVGGRYLALPLSEYQRLESFTDTNDAFIRVAVDIGAAAITDGLRRADLRPEEIDHLFFVTVTGVATPSIDARLVNRLGLRGDLKRTPIFGLGCVAGAAGVARAADYLKAYPDQVAVLLAVELCSLTLQRQDVSVANLIASGLFGDGSAAVVMTGENRLNLGPRIIDTRSVFYRDTEEVMGWRVGADGFQVVLSPDVPKMVAGHLRADVDAFLAGHALTRADIRSYICHSGGPKVLEAFAEALEVPREALALSWASLAEVGNLSSASVLFVLGDVLDAERPAIWLRAISRYGGTISPAPNFAYALGADRITDAEVEGVDLSSWRIALNGAEPVTPTVLERFVARFAAYGLRPEALTPVYGLAEATLAVTFSDLEIPFTWRSFARAGLAEEGVARVASAGIPLVSLGRALPGFALRIADEDGEPVADGRLGRLLVRGPSLMDGYFQRPEATAAVFTDGWLDTGDTGFLYDDDLYLYGRSKDLIILRGRNHAPQEIEPCLDDLEGVRTGCCAAVGVVPEGDDGERLLVLVERGRNPPAEGLLAERVSRRLSDKLGLVPWKVVVLAPGTLPRTSSGKIRRREAGERFLGGSLLPPQQVTFWRLLREMLRSRVSMARVVRGA